jgi:hypothetical protein
MISNYSMIAKLETNIKSDIDYDINVSMINENELLEYSVCLPIVEHR